VVTIAGKQRIGKQKNLFVGGKDASLKISQRENASQAIQVFYKNVYSYSKIITNLSFLDPQTDGRIITIVRFAVCGKGWQEI
jgi:hypothetical protein